VYFSFVQCLIQFLQLFSFRNHRGSHFEKHSRSKPYSGATRFESESEHRMSSLDLSLRMKHVTTSSCPFTLNNSCTWYSVVTTQGRPAMEDVVTRLDTDVFLMWLGFEPNTISLIVSRSIAGNWIKSALSAVRCCHVSTNYHRHCHGGLLVLNASLLNINVPENISTNSTVQLVNKFTAFDETMTYAHWILFYVRWIRSFIYLLFFHGVLCIL
jgi:hypothetical protein